ncbi:hypothetical protein, partial [uncultured Helicobacter sp.]|uniref:hypothetical protein n=1 Tax=uncultured Helicobacter sp. TaxID=175537 RepID=UPI00261BBFCD
MSFYLLIFLHISILCTAKTFCAIYSHKRFITQERIVMPLYLETTKSLYKIPKELTHIDILYHPMGAFI